MGRLGRATLGSVLLTAGLAACGPDKGLPAAKGLPPQDTLAGGMAPAPSNATGGSRATPAQPGAIPTSGGNALTATPPSATGAGATTAVPVVPAGTTGAAAAAGGAGPGGAAQPPAGGRVPAPAGPRGVKK